MNELIGVSYSGLADRFMMLLAGYRLAERIEAKFSFIWETNGHCGAKFEQILKSTVIPVTDDRMHRPDVPMLNAADMGWALTENVVCGWPTEALRLVAFPKVFRPDDFGPGGLIDFAPEIKAAADKYATEQGFGSDTIGLNVRTGDTEEHLDLIPKFIEAANKVLFKRWGNVFLVTDSRNGELVLTRAFPGALKRPRSTYYRLEPQAVIDAAIELCLLRKCKRLVLSGYSGFSRMASNQCLPPSEGVLVVDHT